MLNIRQFVKGVDEPAWVEILNAAFREYESWWRGITVEEMLEQEKGPHFDPRGHYIAELDGKPFGVVRAHFDRSSGEKKGYVSSFGVIPEFRGRGVEERLLEAAVSKLEEHRVKFAQGWTESRRTEQIRVFEEQGFKLAYRTFDMEIDLSKIPSKIGENTEVTVRSLRKDVVEDIRMLNWLENECFKEFPRFKPSTVNETRQSLLDYPHHKAQDFFFAFLDKKAVGYIGVGIDEEFIKQRKAKYGWIRSIGVLEPHRRKGIGTRLMLQGLKTLNAKGMTMAMVDTEDDNPTEAVKFYQRVGFRVVQEYLTYEKGI